MPRVPCLARLNGGPWGLRRRVPDDLRPILGKREIWRSYGTEDFREAKRRHLREMAAVEAEFAEARRLAEKADGDARPPDARLAVPTEDDVQAAVNRWLHGRCRKLVYAEVPDDFEAVLDNLNTDEAHLRGSEGVEVAARLLPAVLRRFGFDIPPPELYRSGLSLMRKAMVEAVRRERDHVGGMAGEQVHDDTFAGVIGAAPPPPLPQPSGPSFADLCDRYLSAPERAGLAPKTRLKYLGFVRVLCDLLGAGTEAARITREDCRRAQAVILAMPANAAQRYPGLTAQQAADRAKRDGVAPMHPNTVGQHLDLLAALFRWGAREKAVRLPDGNPAEGLNAATAKTVTAKAGEKRRKFTTEELRAIFAAPLFTGCKDDGNGYADVGPNHPRRGRFWVPLLALWAGLRLN